MSKDRGTSVTPPNDAAAEAERGNAGAMVARVADEMRRAMHSLLEPGLYLVATPIGNLADTTLRALAVLARADIVCCEDTRHSRTLLHHFAIKAALRPYHEHNAQTERPRVLAELAAGKRVALISDAGTPLVSDPGYKLVREAALLGHKVVAVPGASASLTALVASGLPTDAFFFAGFLPPKQGARLTRIEALRAVPGTLVLFEAPQRLAQTLADLLAALGPRPGAVGRELTKLHEEMVRGTLAELSARFADREVKGEIVILVGPPDDADVTDEAIIGRLEAALREHSLRDAAKAVAGMLGVPRARVYDLGLALKRGNEV
jgi:16S rRNA (cytidine1402-2'-O)-methyltransferase